MKILNRMDLTKIVDGAIKEPLWKSWMKRLYRRKSLTTADLDRINHEIDLIIHAPMPNFDDVKTDPKVSPTEKQ